MLQTLLLMNDKFLFYWKNAKLSHFCKLREKWALFWSYFLTVSFMWKKRPIGKKSKRCIFYVWRAFKIPTFAIILVNDWGHISDIWRRNLIVVRNVPVFQEGGSTPAPPTPPLIRVVLLHTHTERFVQSFNSPTV